MNMCRQFLGIFQNSPAYARDRANLISTGTIGFAALILNGSILMAILILLFDPREFSGLAERVEFGQLLGVVLLTGATVFATVLIPLRLSGVFMGPRIGRYFDQVVLSGISPIRFLMGKVTSQNLFLGLVLFLLMPWFVLVLAVGGLQWHVFIGNLILLWLYSMMLALVMLWLSLYFNEVLALGIMLVLGAFVGGLGVAPIPYQPFVLTPFPALMQGALTAMGELPPEFVRDYGSIFLTSLAAMSFVCLIAFIGLCVGPLYGILRDNSTFGEVVHAGDSKRKRRFRFRMHIQRPSELAFFYQNRGDIFRNWEGLLRWGLSLGTLLVLMTIAWGIYWYGMNLSYSRIKSNALSNYNYFYLGANAIAETIHGFTLFFAVLFFSRARNTMYWSIPLIAGRKVTIATLDWTCFLFVMLLSSGLCGGLPILLHEWFHLPNELPGMPGPIVNQADAYWLIRRYSNFDVWMVHLESTLVLSVSALTLFLMIRTLCLLTWVRTVAVFTGAAFFAFICLPGPFIIAGLVDFVIKSRFDIGTDVAKTLAMMSPIAVFGVNYREMGTSFGYHNSTLPFYIYHGMIIGLCLIFLRKAGNTLKQTSLIWQERGES